MGLSIFEGVAYSLADGVHCLVESGTTFDQIGLAGGGAKSRIWAQIKASVLNLPVVCYKGGEVGPDLGTAKLTMLSLGMEKDDVCFQPEVKEIILPHERYAGTYQKHLERIQRLYKQLESEF